MGDVEPISLRRVAKRDADQMAGGGINGGGGPPRSANAVTAFTRSELSAILAVYGRLMTEGECRDYAMDFGRETAVFSIFRRASEMPLYRIEKCPKLARKQGAYAVVMSTGLILKRGHELPRVLDVLTKKLRLVAR